MHKILTAHVFGVLALFLSVAHAAPSSEVLGEDVEVNLLSLEQIKSLKPSQQELYWLALQDLMLELNENDVNNGVQFANYQQSWWMKEAMAAPGDACAYAGHILKKSARNTCPTSDLPRCKSNANLILCNPIVFGADVCVSPGNKATSSCKKSARSPEKIKEYREQNSQEYAKLQSDFSSFCRKGRQASVCAIVQGSLGEANRVVAGQAFRTPTPRLAPVGSAALVSTSLSANVRVDGPGRSGLKKLSNSDYSALMKADTAALRKNGGCMSELLVLGLKCPGNTTHSLIDPHEAYEIFCNGNKDLLKSRKSAILQQIAEYKSCTQSQLASARADRSERYIQERLKDQASKIAAGEAAVKKCAVVVESGRRIEPREGVRSGELNFTSSRVGYRSAQGVGSVDKYNIAAHLGLLGQWGMGTRLCDYNIVPRNGSAAPSVAPAAAPSSPGSYKNSVK